MKKLFVIPLMAAFAAGSCKKDDGGGHTTGPQHKDTMKFLITGVQPLIMYPRDTVYMPVQVEYISGQKEEISISINNVPHNFYVGIEPVSGTPPFSAELRFISDKTKIGTHVMKLNGNGPGGAQGYYLDLLIKRYINESLNVAGSYTESGVCVQTGTAEHTVIVEPDPAVFHRIHCKGLWTGVGAYDVYADLDTNTHTLSIPSQSVNSVNFTGAGVYNDSVMDIHYKITGSLVNDSCYTKLTRF